MSQIRRFRARIAQEGLKYITERYIPTTTAEQRAMLKTIGVESIDDLLSKVPQKARLSRPLQTRISFPQEPSYAEMNEVAAAGD